MDIHEFELRYRAYAGLQTYFDLGRDDETLVNLVKITNKGTTDKAIQDLTPKEIKKMTIQTYTNFKKDFLKKQEDITKENHTVREYIERLEYELKVIKEMGFNTYFLIVADFCIWAKEHDIVVGPGRGSGAGSLLAWTIKITDVNPLPYDLLFERFLNPARITMPDFDIDFEDTLRDKVIDYVNEKYGADKVTAIGTYMQMATKAAFKDAARALGVVFEKANQISAVIPGGVSLQEAMGDSKEYEELHTLIDNDSTLQEAMALGAKLEGNLRQLGVHACGIIIAPDTIDTFTPIQYVHDDESMQVTQYDGPTLEGLGLLKMDFLGLRNLSVIKNCIKIIIKKFANEKKDIPKMFQHFTKTMSFQPPLDDQFTFENVFQAGDTTGIFQFEGDGMRRFLVKLKANSINDLVAMNALYRPGPMEFIPNYIHRKHGEEEVQYMHNELRTLLTQQYDAAIAEDEAKKLVEDLEPIMNVTYGIAVYQEQLMFLVQSMAGFSLAEADILRRGVGKKKKEVIDKMKKEFIKGCKKHRGYKKETAIYIYEKMIEPAASYSFNKSHSVCYALIAYQTAYLKAHYKVEFYAALMRSVEEDTDTLSNYIDEAKQHGIDVRPPNVNESYNHVGAFGDHVRLGFVGIKGIGRDVGEYIQEERKKNGSYTSLEKFLERCQSVINKKSIESLVKSGALDAFHDRTTLLQHVPQLLERAKSAQNMNSGLFGGHDMTSTISFKETHTTSMMEKLMMEQDVFKTFISGHPLDGLYPFLKKYTFISAFAEIENAGPFIVVGFIKNIQRARKKGFFVQIEDISGKIEFFLKDILSLKKYDMVIVHGYKGRSVSIEKIIKTSREQLVHRARTANKYDETITVTAAKALRTQEKTPVTQESDHQQKIHEQKETPGTSKTNKTHKDSSSAKNIQTQYDGHDTETSNQHPADHNESPNKPAIYKLPDNVEKMHQLIAIIKDCPGEHEIQIGKEVCTLNDTGLEKIQHLLG